MRKGEISSQHLNICYLVKYGSAFSPLLARIIYEVVSYEFVN